MPSPQRIFNCASGTSTVPSFPRQWSLLRHCGVEFLSMQSWGSSMSRVPLNSWFSGWKKKLTGERHWNVGCKRRHPGHVKRHWIPWFWRDWRKLGELASSRRMLISGKHGNTLGCCCRTVVVHHTRRLGWQQSVEKQNNWCRARHEMWRQSSVHGFPGSTMSWPWGVASAPRRARGHRWKSHSSASERHLQPTCQIGVMMKKRGSRRWWNACFMGERRCTVPQVQTSGRRSEWRLWWNMRQQPTVILLKVVPLANRKSYGDLRACVREWTLAQRCFDDGAQHMTLDSSAPMDIGQVQGAKEKGKKWKGDEKDTGKKGNGNVKEKAWTDDFPLKKDQGSKPPAATAQAFASVGQVQSSPPDGAHSDGDDADCENEDSFPDFRCECVCWNSHYLSTMTRNCMMCADTRYMTQCHIKSSRARGDQ